MGVLRDRMIEEMKLRNFSMTKNCGWHTENASTTAPSHPPRSGLVQRRFSQISQDLVVGEWLFSPLKVICSKQFT
jgi:hypothetical protein